MTHLTPNIMKPKHFITHVFDIELPPKGLRKLTFLTTTDAVTTHREYFLGTDNNVVDSDDIDLWTTNRKLFMVSEPISFQENQTLYINFEGRLFLADYRNSRKDQVILSVTMLNFLRKET